MIVLVVAATSAWLALGPLVLIGLFVLCCGLPLLLLLFMGKRGGPPNHG